MSQQPPPLPFTVQYPWFMKLMAVAMLGVLVYLFLPGSWPELVHLWETGGFLFRILAPITGVAIVRGIAEILLQRIVFTELGIEKRTRLLRREFHPYSEIEKMDYRVANSFTPAFIVLIFSDQTKLKIPSGLADLDTIGKIVRTHGNYLGP